MATALSTELLGWVPRGGRVIIDLAARRFLALHPERNPDARDIVQDWEKEALGEFEELRDRPLTGLLFALRVLIQVRQTAHEYFKLPKKAREPLSLATIGRGLFRVVDGLVYAIAAIAMVPAILVGAVVCLVVLPPYLVLMGILMTSDPSEQQARHAAGLEVPPKVEADGSLTPDTQLGDLKAGAPSSNQEAAPSVD